MVTCDGGVLPSNDTTYPCLLYEGGILRKKGFHLCPYLLHTPLLIMFQVCPYPYTQHPEFVLVPPGSPYHHHLLVNNPTSLH